MPDKNNPQGGNSNGGGQQQPQPYQPLITPDKVLQSFEQQAQGTGVPFNQPVPTYQQPKAPTPPKPKTKPKDNTALFNTDVLAERIERATKANVDAALRGQQNVTPELYKQAYEATRKQIADIVLKERDKKLKTMYPDDMFKTHAGFADFGDNKTLLERYKQKNLEDAYDAMTIGSADMGVHSKRRHLREQQYVEQGLSPEQAKVKADKDLIKDAEGNERRKGDLTFKNEFTGEDYFDQNGNPTAAFKRDVMELTKGDLSKAKDAAKFLMDYNFGKWDEQLAPKTKQAQEFAEALAATNPKAYAGLEFVKGVAEGGVEQFFSTIAGGMSVLNGGRYGDGLKVAKRYMDKLAPAQNYKPTTQKDVSWELFDKSKGDWFDALLQAAARSTGQMIGGVAALPGAFGAVSGGTKAIAPALKSTAVGTGMRTALNPSLANTAASKVVSAAAKALGTASAPRMTKYLDNFIGTMATMGPSMYNQYYEDAAAKYGEDEAHGIALKRTLTNAALESFVVPILGSTGKVFKSDKTLSRILKPVSETSGRGIGRAISGMATDAAGEGMEEFTQSMMDAFYDFVEAKKRGAIAPDATFDFQEALSQATSDATVGFTSGVALSAVGRRGEPLSTPQASALVSAIEDVSRFSERLQRQLEKGKVTQEEANAINGFIGVVKPYYEKGKADGLAPEMAMKLGIEQARLEQVNTAIEAEKAKPEINTKRVADLQNLAKETEKVITQLESGTFMRGRTVSGEDLREIAKAYTPNGLKSTQDVSIVANGPYKVEKVPVAQFANNPEVQGLVAVMNNPELAGAYKEQLQPLLDQKREIEDKYKPVKDKQTGITLVPKREMSEDDKAALAEVNDKINELNTQFEGFKDNADAIGFTPQHEVPPVVGEDGKVIDGKKRIAHAIANGEAEIEVARPVTNEEADEVVTTEQEHIVGEIQPNTEGLSDDDTITLGEAFEAFNQHENAPDGYAAAAKVLIDKGVSKKKSLDILHRLQDGNQPKSVLGQYYNSVKNGKREVKDAPEAVQTTEQQIGAREQQQRIEAQQPATATEQQTAEPTVTEPKQQPDPILTAKERLRQAKEKRAASRQNLGIDAFENERQKAEADREVFDAYVNLIREYIKAGVNTLSAVAQDLGEEITDELQRAWDYANNRETVANIQELSDNEVKKTIVTRRAYEGDVRNEVKSELERLGLTRNTENQEATFNNAVEFVNQVGIDNAIAAVERGDVKGGGATAIYGAAIIKLQEEVLNATSPDEMQRLSSLQAHLIEEMSQLGTDAGQRSAMFNYIYNNTDIGFNVEAKIKEYKDANSGEIPPEAEQKIRDAFAKIEELNVKIAELNKAKADAEAAAAVDNIKEDVKRNPPKKSYAKRAKKIADEFRKLKTKPLILRDADGNPIELTPMGFTWNDLIEIGAKAIEATGKVADGIAAVTERISEVDWFRKLSDRDQKAVLDQISSFFVEEQAEEVTPGPVKVPHAMIREAVENGATDINSLVSTIKEQLKDEYPNATDREIRDAITGYGKTVNLSQEEINVQIRKLKRLGKALSALEDIEAKKRPLRSGLQRDKLDAEERAMLKEIREAMKELPLDQETLDRELKTRLDAAKTRLQNQIEDLQRAIETGEKLVAKNNKPIEGDAELKALKEQLDILRTAYEETFQEPALTEGQKKIKSLEAQLERLRTRNLPESKDQPEYSEDEKKQIEELKEEIYDAKVKAGLVPSKELPKDPTEVEVERKIKAKEKQILELAEKLSKGDLSTKGKSKQGATTPELEALKEEYEALRNELSERRKAAKVKLTPEEKSIKRLQEQLDGLLAGNINNKEREIRQRSQAEIDLIDQIEEQKQLLGLVRSKPTPEQLRLDTLDKAIEETERKIRDNDLEIKKTSGKAESTAVAAKKSRLQEALEALKQARESAGIIEKNRLDAAKKATQKRIEDLQRRLREKDFDKKKRTPLIEDSELTKLKAEQMRLKDEVDKEIYKVKLRNRTKWQKAKDVLVDAWNVTRLLRATGEGSFVLIQGAPLTFKYLYKNPKKVAEASKNALRFFASESKTEQWLNEIKSQDWYVVAKRTKLAITEPHAELSAREELFYSGWTDMLWDNISKIFKPFSQSAYERVKLLNPFKAFERASVGYLDTLRAARFVDGMQMLEEKGMTPQNNIEEYEALSNVINTLSGRASLNFGKDKSSKASLEPMAKNLTMIFFSPRNWASIMKQTILLPFWFRQLTPTSRKTAMIDMAAYLGTTTAIVAMAAAYLNNDDDDETKVELDPRSSDFGKIKLGNTRVDPWSGRVQQFVLLSQIVAGIKDTRDGVVRPTGIKYGNRRFGDKPTKTRLDLIFQMATNKLSPTAGIAYRSLSSGLKRDKTGEFVKVDQYGREYALSDEILGNTYPIYWETVNEILQDDPTALDGFLLFYAYFGGGLQVYEDDKKNKKK